MPHGSGVDEAVAAGETVKAVAGVHVDASCGALGVVGLQSL